MLSIIPLQILASHPNIKELTPLDTMIFTNDDRKKLSCMNELTIKKRDFSSLRCEVLVDDQLLDKYVGDGLVISTSIGSTGYNLALGGPIIDNDINLLTITPLVPIINKVYKSLNNSIVFGSKRRITIILYDSNNLCLLNDGKVNNLINLDKIECSLSSKTIKCLMPVDYNYIENLKSKIIDVGE